MRSGICSLILLFTLLGCASAPPFRGSREDLVKTKDWPQGTQADFLEGKVKIGMTQEQIFRLLGSPYYWSRYELQEGVFESWFWAMPENANDVRVASCDFKNGILTGFSGGTKTNVMSTKGCYYTKDKIFDLRNYSK